MLLSRPVLTQQLGRYRAIRKDIKLNLWGYWEVTYSCAPGIDLTLTHAKMGGSPSEAIMATDALLSYLTNQEIM